MILKKLYYTFGNVPEALKFLFLFKNTLFSQLFKEGPVAEWLGKALQKLLQRFESARDLTSTSIPSLMERDFFNYYATKNSQ
jgi:hypothetical protein